MVRIGIILLLTTLTCFADGVFGPAQGGVFGARRAAVSVASPYWTDTNTYAGLWEFETTNSVATLDTSGNNYHVTNLPNVSAGAVYTIIGTNSQGRVEHGYLFDGSDDAFQEGTLGASINLGSNYILGAWIYYTKGTFDAVDSIIQVAEPSGNHQAILGLLDGYIEFNTYEGGYGRFSAPSRPTSNAWHCVGIMKIGTTGYIYQDGSLVATGTVKNVTSCNTLRIGNYVYNNLFAFEGYIDNPFCITNPAYVSESVLDSIYQYTNPTNNLRNRP